jgi:protein-L-isoaspartate(D-aspartate) O-methyltransferase
MTRAFMVESQLRARGISESLRAEAYEDHPLPIGEGQTISQPYVVAVMLQYLQLAATDTVLEIGAGSGYVTALLAELAAQVFSIERHPALAANGRAILAKLGYANVELITGDGTLGLPAHAPFDAILVSAAALEVPAALLAQLRDGGRMVIPVGSADSQQLQFIRMINGQPITSLRDPVRFVPLIQDRD